MNSAVFTPVATVVSAPLVGSVPLSKVPSVQLRMSVLFWTVAVILGNVHSGRVPTFVIEFTVAVLSVTATSPVGVPVTWILPSVPVNVGLETVPLGVISPLA